MPGWLIEPLCLLGTNRLGKQHAINKRQSRGLGVSKKGKRITFIFMYVCKYVTTDLAPQIVRVYQRWSCLKNTWMILFRSYCSALCLSIG